MENMDIYNAVKKPPPFALKPITGGRLRGFTDVNPQWRIMVMTEHFGVCGVGWKYTIEKLWLEPVSAEICAFAEVALSIKVDGEWSSPIPGIGGSMLLEKETKGFHVSDECYKMAITDALSVAMKMLGVAGDVYAGAFDGSKYSERSSVSKKAPEEKSQVDTPPPEASKEEPGKPAAPVGDSSHSKGEVGGIDMDWLEESLKVLQDKGIKAYSDKTILAYINAITRAEPKHATISEAVAKLDKAQANGLVKRVSDALEMA